MLALRSMAAKGGAYFGIVFAVGFALGVVRVTWLVPRLGERWAELVELPVMVAASFSAARWIVRRGPRPAGRGAALGIGGLALGLLVAAELFVVLRLRGIPFGDYVQGRDPVSGAAYGVSLLLFGIAPVLMARPRA